jgi:acetyltransferase-like isoleucine patch superfamily enzyme
MLTRLLAIFITFPLLLRFKTKPDHRVFKRIAETISVIPGNLGLRVRSCFYGKTLTHCGAHTEFGFGTILNYPDISIGKEVSFGRHCNVGLADFDDFAIVASYCQFLSGNETHAFEDTDIPIRKQKATRNRISIGKDVWIGAGAIVMASVDNGAVVGAGSVVSRPVGSWQIAAGNPARLLRMRRNDTPEASVNE